MTHGLRTRALTRADLVAVATVLDETGMFPSDLLPDMAAPFLGGSAGHLWLVACEGEAVLGFAFVEPERMTDATHNLLAIGVSPARQNGGVGKALIAAVEQRLRAKQGRVLLVETSSLAEFEGARAFYEGLGFAREARIREFYAKGEDKIVFWKAL